MPQPLQKARQTHVTQLTHPHHPRTAVGAIVLKDDTVLLIKRAKAPNVGKWSIPGGKQELGETVTETLAREVLEETGIHATARDLVDVVDLIDRDENGTIAYHYTLVDYWAETDDYNFTIDKTEISEARWVPISEIGKYGLWDETIRVIELSLEKRQLKTPVNTPIIRTKHTLSGHIRAAVLAILFGMGAYAFIHALRYILA